jgi:hypothetical protein
MYFGAPPLELAIHITWEDGALESRDSRLGLSIGAAARLYAPKAPIPFQSPALSSRARPHPRLAFAGAPHDLDGFVTLT